MLQINIKLKLSIIGHKNHIHVCILITLYRVSTCNAFNLYIFQSCGLYLGSLKALQPGNTVLKLCDCTTQSLSLNLDEIVIICFYTVYFSIVNTLLSNFFKLNKYVFLDSNHLCVFLMRRMQP